MVTLEDCQQAGSYEYKGLSTDTKPTDCAVNSLFLELDTGYFYYFDGSTWVKTKSGDGYSTFKSLIDRSITEVTEEMTEGVGYIGDSAFVGCSHLTKVTIGSSLSGISPFAFWNCSALTSVDLSKGVTQIYDCVFENCSSLTNLKLGDRLRSIGGSSFKGCTGLPEIKIPDGTKTIGGSAFENCSGATTLSLPSTLESIGEFAFKGCRRIKSITIPSSITSIQASTFEDCSGATSLSLSPGTKYIGKWAFKNCESLSQIYIPYGVETLDSEAFIDCSGATNLNLPRSLTSLGGFCFANCSKLAGKVTIPNSLSGNYAFVGSSFFSCKKIVEVYIEDGVSRVGDSTFQECTSLSKIYFPGSLGTSQFAGNIGDQACMGCTNLQTIDVKEGVKIIGISAFSGCYKLTNVTLPSSINHISKRAFYYSGMYSLTINAEWPPILDEDGIYRWSLNGNYLPKIYVPSGSESRYRSATRWSNFDIL